MIEILAPAGNAECALAALNNGANAIYLGLSAFSARQSADNFDFEGLEKIIAQAHFRGAKVYVAMNTLVKDEETETFVRTLLQVWAAGIDAVILQDPLLGKAIHALYPEIVLHLSTQAGVCTLNGAKFAKECGFSRVILARETPLNEIRKIAEYIETEVFVQGALCAAFSGQCYFSSFAGGNSGNRGRCKQPCRKRYAYDRNGNTEYSYALSLSDLSVGEDVQKLIDAGVVSFKIEGRMRRAEYVGAAVKYYRNLLDCTGNNTKNLSDLKRTYNRGNYTKGLAFGQDKRFLSPNVQGHLGEKVGVVKVQNAKYYVESLFRPQSGDSFKVLRDGKELGGAVYVKTEGKSFIVSSKARLKNGDGVFVTTDLEVSKRVLSTLKMGKIRLSIHFHEGELPLVECEDMIIKGETTLQTALNRPLQKEELQACFDKTDGLPIDVEYSYIDVQGNIFLPKSELNAFRRRVYAALSERVLGKRTPLNYLALPCRVDLPQEENQKTAVIADDFANLKADVAIYKPNDYSKDIPQSFLQGSFEKYLYYPAFITENEERQIAQWLKRYNLDGIYTENYGGIAFAKAQNCLIFAGTGLNIINPISLNELLKNPQIAYYAISKETTAKEGEKLVGKTAFVLSSGNIKLMDLPYCPFGKTCSVCDKKEEYELRDENGRIFPAKRYLSADGACRFEIYNCASLVGVGLKGFGKLLDVSVCKEKEGAFLARNDEEKQKELYKTYTSGHFRRGVE